MIAKAAVTGATGYLGSAVLASAHPGVIVHQLPKDLSGTAPTESGMALGPCDRLVACHGALRCASEAALNRANVLYTEAAILAVGRETPVIYASSRFARVQTDPYGQSKVQGEQRCRHLSASSAALRFCVLAGPAPSGLGSSFVTRMTERAIANRVIEVPVSPRQCGFIDVRDAATMLWRLPIAVGHLTFDVTPQTLSLESVAQDIADAVESRLGRRPLISRRPFSGNPPPSPGQDLWTEVCSASGVTPTEPTQTIVDTVDALLGAP